MHKRLDLVHFGVHRFRNSVVWSEALEQLLSREDPSLYLGYQKWLKTLNVLQILNKESRVEGLTFFDSSAILLLILNLIRREARLHTFLDYFNL